MEVKKFRELSISTQTVIAYTNCSFDIQSIFDCLNVQETECTKNGDIQLIKKNGQTKGDVTKNGNLKNQILLKIFIIDKIITVKMFRTGSIHMTGCKHLQHQIQTVITLLNILNPKSYQMNSDKLEFVLDVVMNNVHFNLPLLTKGTIINKSKLDKAMRKLENSEFYINFNKSVSTSVNIKYDYEFVELDCRKIIVNEDNTYTTSIVKKPTKTKKKELGTQSFFVFGSGKVTQSGRCYDTIMEEAYDKFINILTSNIREIIDTTDKSFDFDKLHLPIFYKTT